MLPDRFPFKIIFEQYLECREGYPKPSLAFFYHISWDFTDFISGISPIF